MWWVELAALTDGTLVAAAIARALGVSVDNHRPVLETVVALLRKQTALLVLDNCEHLLDAAAECVRVLLRDAPTVRVLITSQEALHTIEEQVYRLGGLRAADALDAPAVELFVARARAADPRLQLTSANVSAIAEICRRLDGMPLAIELAAARLRLLGVEGLRARLDERFQILTGGTRAALRRHQTLRAALDWSYGLLLPEEQTVFRPVSECLLTASLSNLHRMLRLMNRSIGGPCWIGSVTWSTDRSWSPTVTNCRAIAAGTMRAFALGRNWQPPARHRLCLKRQCRSVARLSLPLHEQRWNLSAADQSGQARNWTTAGSTCRAESAAGDREFACT